MQLGYSHEFRMRSPVGWLCFGILVVCVIISVDSGVSPGNYQIIHGHGYGYPGAVLQRVVPVPAVGYRSVVPRIVAMRVKGRSEDEDEPEPYEPEEEDVDEYPYPFIPPFGPAPPYHHIIEEEQDREEEEEMAEDEGEFEHGGPVDKEDSEEDDEMHMYGRQIYKNNNKVHRNVTVLIKPAKTPTKIRTTLQKSSSKDGQRKANSKSYSAKKKKTYQIPEEISPTKTTSKNSNIVYESIESPKPTHQLKGISNSHAQFVATPIGDLILKLSISLARPIGYGNGTATYLNVPIRLSNTGSASEENNISKLNASTLSKVEADLHKINSIITSPDPFKVVTAPLKAEVSEVEEIDDKEDEVDVDRVAA